jgi:hypothetical protein
MIMRTDRSGHTGTMTESAGRLIGANNRLHPGWFNIVKKTDPDWIGTW